VNVETYQDTLSLHRAIVQRTPPRPTPSKAPPNLITNYLIGRPCPAPTNIPCRGTKVNPRQDSTTTTRNATPGPTQQLPLLLPPQVRTPAKNPTTVQYEDVRPCQAYGTFCCLFVSFNFSKF
jgi:hypothetical protein